MHEPLTNDNVSPNRNESHHTVLNAVPTPHSDSVLYSCYWLPLFTQVSVFGTSEVGWITNQRKVWTAQRGMSNFHLRWRGPAIDVASNIKPVSPGGWNSAFTLVKANPKDIYSYRYWRMTMFLIIHESTGHNRQKDEAITMCSKLGPGFGHVGHRPNV